MAEKKCPYCAEDIKADALKCKHCGEWLAANAGRKRSLNVPIAPARPAHEVYNAPPPNPHPAPIQEKVIVKHQGGGCCGCLIAMVALIVLFFILVFVFKVGVVVAIAGAIAAAFANFAPGLERFIEQLMH